MEHCEEGLRPQGQLALKTCKGPMQADQFGRRDHGHGCEANNSLLEHRLIESERAGKAAWIRSFSSLFVSVCDCVWLTL